MCSRSQGDLEAGWRRSISQPRSLQSGRLGLVSFGPALSFTSDFATRSVGYHGQRRCQ
jgi:hypothetical protein